MLSHTHIHTLGAVVEKQFRTIFDPCPQIWRKRPIDAAIATEITEHLEELNDAKNFLLF